MGDAEDFTQLSLPDQFQHKNWKARKGGYETATKEFKTAQPSDPIVREFILESSLWKAAVSDGNVAAQQEALQAYNAFLDAAGTEGARKTRSHTVGGIVEKGLIGRPAAKAAATESLLLLIELDKADPIVEELLPYLAHKMPKLVTAALSALTAIYHAYGCKTVEPKPVIKLLPKVFGHADKNVRAEAQNLTVELYRWLREAMKPLFWGELKDVQQKDLEKLFEPIKNEPQPKQERLLRSQQAAQEEAVASGAGDGEQEAVEGEGDEGGEIDLEPEYEAVDVLAKVPKDFGDRLASSKWKDRKDALDELYAAVNVPAIQEGQFDDILRACAKSMKDANIAVVTVAANCVERIANGLRKSFSRYKGTILGPMLERFKEKKATVTDAISAACDAVFSATSLGEVEPEVLEALKNKNPQIKEHSAKFLIRCLKSTRDAPSLEQTKTCSEAGKKLLTESVATLRDAGAEILGVLWKIMGDRNMLNHLEGLDGIRKTKIKEFSDAAEVKAKWKPKAAPPPKAAAPAATPGRKPALGSKRAPPGAKKPPPKAASPPPTEPAELKPRATSRPVGKPGGLRPPGSGLKGPSGLSKPGAGLRAPGSSSGTSSPKRPVPTLEDSAPAVSKATGLNGAGRGLAGRSLGKPSTTAPATAPTPPSPASPPPEHNNALADLRAEADLLRAQTADLRADKLRLTTQLAELQVANAQLIEEHTRDVLRVKAKANQVVRAREAEAEADERAGASAREVERLRREVARLGRAAGGAMSPPLYSDGYAGFAADMGFAPAPAGRPGYGAEARAYTSPVAARTPRGSSGDGGGSAGKENIPDHSGSGSPQASVTTDKVPAYGFGRAHSASSARPLSNGGGGGYTSSGRGTPVSFAAAHEGEAGTGDGHSRVPSAGAAGTTAHARLGSAAAVGGLERSSSTSSASAAGSGGGVESWRRAAEVTQNLKARIEVMK
ncbi:hypothetical protein B0A50_00023 [Salinomyces thailandicus]|uniref:TOG domain-containing protein n=1 Tax=Salinomyces thailandicus TaxID=706561 RepID=A0A4U0UEU1_9PEZI|nr:hypothetical protein B0A50_00023 [Salinomyces thailandica]